MGSITGRRKQKTIKLLLAANLLSIVYETMGSNSNDLLVEYQGNMYEWNNVSVRKLLFSKLIWVWEFLLYNMYDSRKKRVPEPTMNYNYNIIEIQLSKVVVIDVGARKQ